MGRDKLSLEVGGVPLIARVHATLGELCEEVLIVGDGGAGAVPDARRISDARPGRQGPLAGLEAGLEAVEGERAFAVAGDMPFVGEELLRHLVGLVGDGSQAAIPVEGERLHPLCAAYDRGVLTTMREALDSGIRDMRGFLGALGRVSYVRVDGGEFGEAGEILMNVNSPEDLDLARSIASGLTS